MLEPTGTNLDPDARELTLTWTDGETTRHDFTELRRLCPCASCRGEREKVKSEVGLRVISGAGEPNLKPVILRLEPVGRYALRFFWSDRHSAGIYTYQFLREHRSEA